MDFQNRFALRFPTLLLAATLALPALGQAVPDVEPERAPPAPSTSPPGATYTPSAPRPPQVNQQVELEIAFLVDSSSSVSDEEFELQQQGYVDAFRDAEVQAAILANEGVVARYVEWSGRHEIKTYRWTTLDSAEDIEAYATEIDKIERWMRHGTNMAYALENTLWSMHSNRWDSDRQVIDVSGDGVCVNQYHYRNGASTSNAYGRPWDEVLLARKPTTTINGISIGDNPDLIQWYEDTVPQGEGAFAMNARSFEDFGDAIKQKLIREITPESNPLVGYD